MSFIGDLFGQAEPTTPAATKPIPIPPQTPMPPDKNPDLVVKDNTAHAVGIRG